MQHYIPVVCGHIHERFRHTTGFQEGNYEKGYVFVIDDSLLPILSVTTQGGIAGWKCASIFIPKHALYTTFKEAEDALREVEAYKA